MNVEDIRLLGLEEDPVKVEQSYLDMHKESITQPSTKFLLESIYYEKDRDGAFQRFLKSVDFRTILNILELFNVDRNMEVCEIGGGPGFLTWALSQHGFRYLDLLEPNEQYYTGIGYFRSRKDTSHVRTFTDLKEFYEDSKTYDIILTRNCIHHFPNISMTAAMIRKKMKPGAHWFAFREQFAESPYELYTKLREHPVSQKYYVYEWYYPVRHYVESVEIAGFQLSAVLPDGYANNALSTYSEGDWSEEIKHFTDSVNDILMTDATRTVRSFWDELDRKKKKRTYTSPQMFLFQRDEIRPDNLIEMNRVEKFAGKRIIIFGSGSSCSYLIKRFPIDIAYLVDNNSAKWKTEFEGKVIENPTRILEEKKKDFHVFVASVYYSEISQQLTQWGLEEGVDFSDSQLLWENDD